MSKNFQSIAPNDEVSTVQDLGGKADITLMAPAYSSSSAYKKDAWVTYNGLLYQAKQDIATAEAWTPEHWTQKPAMTTPDARLVSNDSENHMYMTELVDGTDAVKWSDEYKLTSGTVSNNAITVKRGEITAVTLADGSTPLQLAFSTQDTGFARDFMVAVTLPTTAVTGIQPLALPSGVIRVWTQEDPWNSYDAAKDLGKTFLYCFTDLNDANRMLINRMELKSVPTISDVTGTASGTVTAGTAATVTGTFLSEASKVEFCSDTTAATPTWTAFTAANYTVNHAGLITLGTAATSQITTAASGTGGIRVTTGNGTVSKTGLTFVVSA